MESGGEADTNVERVETVEGGTAQRVAAPAARAGARIDHHDAVLGGSYLLALSGLARMVANADTKPENVMLYAGEGRWLHPLGARPLGWACTSPPRIRSRSPAAPARARSATSAATRCSCWAAADDHLTLAVVVATSATSPIIASTGAGPSPCTARYPLWPTSGKTESLELATALGFEARSYMSRAWPAARRPTVPDFCYLDTALRAVIAISAPAPS